MADDGTDKTNEAAALAPKTLSRRKVLGSIAAGTVVLGVPSVAAAQDGRRGRQGTRGRGGGPGRRPGNGAEEVAVAAPTQAVAPAGPAQFSRMFDDAAFQEVDDELTVMLAELGAPGGILDAKDPLEEGPIRLITELELSANNANNPEHTAGTTFMGQFLDHDITRDSGSPLGQPT